MKKKLQHTAWEEMCQSFIGRQSHYNSPIFWGFVSRNLLKIMPTKNHFWCKFYVSQKFWESFRNFARMRQLVTLCQCRWKCWFLCYTLRAWVAGPMSRLFCPQNIIDILLNGASSWQIHSPKLKGVLAGFSSNSFCHFKLLNHIRYTIPSSLVIWFRLAH